MTNGTIRRRMVHVWYDFIVYPSLEAAFRNAHGAYLRLLAHDSRTNIKTSQNSVFWLIYLSRSAL